MKYYKVKIKFPFKKETQTRCFYAENLLDLDFKLIDYASKSQISFDIVSISVIHLTGNFDYNHENNI